MKRILLLLMIPVFYGTSGFSATGEMGNGIPNFGIYTKNASPHITIWNLESATIGFPAGCTNLQVTPDILGLDHYKIVVATLLMAKATRKKVRFYNHSTLNGNCGFDYIQLSE